MQYDLNDKIIIITGGNSGIGKAASIQLAKYGATVVLACRSKERGAQAVKEVRHAASSTKVELLQVDMSLQKSVRQFVDEFNNCYERLDVLIHNAANFVAIPNERLAHLPKWMLRMYEAKRTFSMTPEKMAETYTWLAADPVGEKQTGSDWDAPAVEVKANKNAYDTATQKSLWDISALLTGV